MRDTGCLPSVAVRSEKGVVRTINTRENILEMVQRSPRLPTRRNSRIGVSCMQVWRTLHEEDLYPYHDQTVKHLEPGDHAQRMDLCRWITAHSQLFSVILFTDDASFTGDDINNLQNFHKMAHRNSHVSFLIHIQSRFSLKVLCGILGKRLIGSFVFDNNLRGNIYKDFLRNDLQVSWKTSR